MLERKCTICKIVKPVEQFSRRNNTKCKRVAQCKACRHLKMIEYLSSERSHVITVVSAIFKPSNCKKRGLWPAITKQGIWEKLIIYIQDMKEKFPGTNGRICYYCNNPWTNKVSLGEKRQKNLNNFSIDRLDNTKTYMEENIVFCCGGCNDSKHSITFQMIDRIQQIRKERNLL